MSVRLMTNRSDTLPTANKAYHTNVQFSTALQLLMHSRADPKNFIKAKPLEKKIVQLFQLYDQY